MKTTTEKMGTPRGRLKPPFGLVALAIVVVAAAGPAPCLAQDETDLADLAKQTQNPVSDLISLPFQKNFNFDLGPRHDFQYVLNIQPVVPFHVTRDWNLITRTIVPLISQPELAPGVGDLFGLGDIQLSLFLSPEKPGALIWGAGPVVQFPSGTDDSLGTGKWRIGPTAVALTVQGPWVSGALINNLWSFAGDSKRDGVNQMLLQPFVNYNLPRGWYLASSPIITANWEATGGDRWAVPVGDGVGKIFRVGPLPVNSSLAGFANVVRPTAGPDWTLRFQVQFLLPK